MNGSNLEKVVVDTNFLMAISQFKIDILAELKPNKIIIIDKTIKELKNLKEKEKTKMHATIALKLIKGLPILKTKDGKTDDILAELSKEGYIIATQDRGLKRRLKNTYIVIRQKKYLRIVNQNIY